jgi:hypothetical protein
VKWQLTDRLAIQNDVSIASNEGNLFYEFVYLCACFTYNNLNKTVTFFLNVYEGDVFPGRFFDCGEDADDGPEPGGVGPTVEDQLHRG